MPVCQKCSAPAPYHLPSCTFPQEATGFLPWTTQGRGHRCLLSKPTRCQPGCGHRLSSLGPGIQEHPGPGRDKSCGSAWESVVDRVGTGSQRRSRCITSPPVLQTEDPVPASNPGAVEGGRRTYRGCQEGSALGRGRPRKRGAAVPSRQGRERL